MERKRYDLNYKKMVVSKSREIGNMTAVARQHDLDPKMVLRWAKQLKRKDIGELDGAAFKHAAFVPTAADTQPWRRSMRSSRSSMQSRRWRGKSSVTW